MKKTLVLINIISLTIANCGTPLIMRLYFLNGGKRIWFSSWLITALWPLILIPIYISYLHRLRTKPHPQNLFLIKPPFFTASAFIGLLTGLDDYLIAYGVSRLPASTSSLIIASQLAFTAVFAFLLVKHKFTSYSVNSVFLLTIGGAVLALHTDGDRPEGESSKEYVIGFVMTVGGAALCGLTLPLIELVFKKTEQEMSYSLVLECQMVINLFATLFCTVGMLIHNDFKVIGREAKEFGLGESTYYLVVVANAVICQCFIGSVGVIFYASSLMSGIVISATLPVTEVLAVIFFSEKFQAEKGVSLVLSLWGFVSYFYGEIKHERKVKKKKNVIEQSSTASEIDMPKMVINP